MRSATPHPDSGFTLVEVLISMFIFSLISVGALIALTTTLNAREAAEAKLNELEQLAAMRALMGEDFALRIVRENRDGLGSFIDELDLRPWDGTLNLTRRARPNPGGLFPRGDLMRVSWRVENNQLIRSFLPHENPAYVEPPLDRVILEGVQEMEFQILIPDDIMKSVGTDSDRLDNDPPGTGLAGMRTLQPLSVIKGAVDIRLTHSDGTTTRHLFELPDAKA